MKFNILKYVIAKALTYFFIILGINSYIFSYFKIVVFKLIYGGIVMPNDDKIKTASAHTLLLDANGNLKLTGVIDVTSFDETLVSLETSKGMLAVKGENLHVEGLSLEKGELTLTGSVNCMEYDDNIENRGGIFARLFG